MTNNNIPTFSGAAGTASGDSPTITVNVYAGFSAVGIPVQALTATAHSGSWSVSADAPLEDGTYTAQAIQRDEVGNVGESIADTFAIDTTPPGPVTVLRVVPASDGLHITWAGPSDADYAGAMIRRSEGNAAPSSPTSGTLIATAPAGTTSFDDKTVTPGHTYSYAVFAYDDVPNYAVGAVATQTMPACTDSWTGNAGSLDWGTAGNWSKDQTPGAGDVACVFGSDEESPVNYATGTSSVSQLVATRPITLTGGELDLAATSSASVTTDLHLNGGSIGGAGNLVLDGETSWESGSLLGGGDTAVPAGSTLIVADASCNLCAKVGDGHTLTVGGTLDVAGSSSLYLAGTAQLVNSGTVDFEGEGNVTADAGPASLFVNQGMVEKTGGATSAIGSLFDNSGSVSVTAGKLYLYGGNSAGASDSGSYTATGSETAIVFAFGGSRVLGSHASLTGTVEWFEGEVSGTVAAGSTLTVADASCNLCAKVGDGHTLTVGGTLDVAGSSSLYLAGTAQLVNSGTVDFEGEGNVTADAGPASLFVNQGMVEKTGGATSAIGSLFDNSGSVSVTAGKLYLYGGNSAGASDSGSYTATGSETAIVFAFGGSRVLGSHASLTGTVEWFEGEVSGTVAAGSTLTVADASCNLCAKVGDGHTLTVGGTLGALDNSRLALEKESTVIFKADSVFKAGQGVGLNIPAGATLNSEGTQEHPVIFTAITDDTVGSHINHKAVVKPSAGEWSGIEIVGGGAIPLNTNLGYIEMRYATIALALRGEGNVAVRGAFTNDLKAVEACNWGTSDCSVDAAYTYWGSPEGPFPSGGSPLTCGAVTTSPYRTSASSEATSNTKSAFAANCDSSPTPEERLASAQASASAHISSEDIRCGEGFKEACEVIEMYKKCLGAAAQLAAEQSPFTFSDGAQSVGSDGASWLEKSESVVVSSIGHVASFGFQIVGVANTILSIANAYNTCA
jgi:Bacterial Ig-like domain